MEQVVGPVSVRDAECQETELQDDDGRADTLMTSDGPATRDMIMHSIPFLGYV